MSYLYSGNSAAKCYCIFESFVCTKYNNVLFISRLMKNTAVNPSMSRNPVLSRIGPLIWDLYTVSVSPVNINSVGMERSCRLVIIAQFQEEVIFYRGKLYD